MKYVILFGVGLLGAFATVAYGYPTYRPYLQTLKPVKKHW